MRRRWSSLALVPLMTLTVWVGPTEARGLLGPSPTTITLGPTVSAIRVGHRATVSGSISGLVRTVNLQVHTAQGWQTRSSALSALGRFRLPLPTGYDGRRRWRVTAGAALGFAAATSSARTLVVRPAYTPTGTARQWRFAEPGIVSRWNPCRVIPYHVNLGGTPLRNLVLVRRALNQVSQATGFRFRFAGTTARVPFAGGGSVNGSGLFIAWTTARVVPGLRGRAVGLGGSGSMTYGDQDDWRITSGGVAIDKAGTGNLFQGFRKGATLGAVLLHELGHAMGLGHVNAPNQIMNPTITSRTPLHYGAGDLTGLERLGADQGCFSTSLGA